MLAEEIARARNNSDPNRCAEKVVCEKLPPGHSKHPGHGAGYDPHAEEEPREENGYSPVSREKFLAAIEGGFRDAEEGPVTLK
jgi:hypothetical protein